MIDSELSGEQYVATFGKDAAVGCFTATEPIALRRGDQVLLRTPRGIEVGSILCPATVRQARLLGAQVHGDLLRSFDADDRRRLVDLRRQASAILDVAHALADESEPDLMVLDAEMLFDGQQVIVQVLHADPDRLAEFARKLGERVGVEVRLANLVPPAELLEVAEVGCGKPDCGKKDTDGGGCSTCSSGGGCSSSSCSSAAGAVDLRPYFSHLRSQMEASQRVPLN